MPDPGQSQQTPTDLRESPKLPAQVLNGQHGNGGAGIDMLLRHREVTARSGDVQ